MSKVYQIGHTDDLIKDIGLYLEQRAVPSHALLVSYSLAGAEHVMRHTLPRVQWMRKLREGMVISRVRRTVLFGNGSSLMVMGSGSVKNGSSRGLRLDAVFVDDRCYFDANTARMMDHSLRPCLY